MCVAAQCSVLPLEPNWEDFDTKWHLPNSTVFPRQLRVVANCKEIPGLLRGVSQRAHVLTGCPWDNGENLQVLSPLHYFALYICSNYQKGSTAWDRWDFEKQLCDIHSGTGKCGQHISELTWQHFQSEFKTSNCRKRRWKPELGLVPESDITSSNNDLNAGGFIDFSSLYLFSLMEKLHLKCVLEWKFSSFPFYSVCFPC